MKEIAVITSKVKVFRETDNEWFTSKVHQGVTNLPYQDHFTITSFVQVLEKWPLDSAKREGSGRSIEV